jgi:hypothetical protein
MEDINDIIVIETFPGRYMFYAIDREFLYKKIGITEHEYWNIMRKYNVCIISGASYFYSKENAQGAVDDFNILYEMVK